MSYLERLMAQGERPLFVTRTHWTSFVGRTINLWLLLLVLAAVGGVANYFMGDISYFASLDTAVQWLVRVGVVLVLVIYPVVRITFRYVRWRLEQFVITNLRVIHLRGILSKNVLDSSLEKVNDVQMSQSLLGRMFDFGDLEILTASEVAINKLKRIARPLAFKTAMVNAKQQLELPGVVTAAVGPQESIPEMIGQLATLRDRGVISEADFQREKAQLLEELGRPK